METLEEYLLDIFPSPWDYPEEWWEEDYCPTTSSPDEDLIVRAYNALQLLWYDGGSFANHPHLKR